jgi:hypothetical protein
MALRRIPRVGRQTRFVTGTTPFPNFLLDRVMPRLTDTEWRLLCVIVRQTFGWHLGGGVRKKADWMSHFQLKQRTGRESAAISRAIAGLVRAGLIAVRDEHGRPLYTAYMRRRSHEHLVFSFHPLVATRRFQKMFAHARFGISYARKNKNK